MEFVNRESELKALNEWWRQDKAHLVIIYGKRRIGKTCLIKEFIKNKKSIYFLADKVTEQEILKLLSQKIGVYFDDKLIRERGFGNWYQIFDYIKNKNEHIVIVIDEFPYLVEVNKAISSIFQHGWDEELKDSKIMMILSGSSIGMMETETLAYRAPLYGRRSGQILVKSLSFTQSHRFFTNLKFEDFVLIHTITGGIPAYLLQFDKNLSLIENIKKYILDPKQFLYNEVEFILREELREPRTYLSILKAIAYGKRKFGEIVNDTGLQKNIIMKYLHILESLHLIKKEIPVTEKNPHLSKKGLYRLEDQFFIFWFNFVFPYKSELEIEKIGLVISQFKLKFGLLVTNNYERIACEILNEVSDKIFPFLKIGRWWDRNEEIDIVATNEEENKILFCEVKWSNKQVGTDIYNNLRRKSQLVEWGKKGRKEYFCLFSKSGFTPEMKQLARDEKIILFEKDHIVF